MVSPRRFPYPHTPSDVEGRGALHCEGREDGWEEGNTDLMFLGEVISFVVRAVAAVG